MRYISPEMKNYDAFIVDPVQSRLSGKVLSPAERAEALNYFQDAAIKAIRDARFTVTDDVGPNVARISIALTDVAESTWWMKLHPGMRLSGSGTGGAAMEAEIVDSMSGKVLAAVVQSSPGNQFDLTNFSTLADVKTAIDKWAQQFKRRLEEIRVQANKRG